MCIFLYYLYKLLTKTDGKLMETGRSIDGNWRSIDGNWTVY